MWNVCCLLYIACSEIKKFFAVWQGRMLQLRDIPRPSDAESDSTPPIFNRGPNSFMARHSSPPGQPVRTEPPNLFLSRTSKKPLLGPVGPIGTGSRWHRWPSSRPSASEDPSAPWPSLSAFGLLALSVLLARWRGCASPHPPANVEEAKASSNSSIFVIFTFHQAGHRHL